MAITKYSFQKKGGDFLNLEESISKCIEEKGIALSAVSRKTGIPYMSLYNSLMNRKSTWELRGRELVSVCAFLDIDPRDFAEESTAGGR